MESIESARRPMPVGTYLEGLSLPEPVAAAEAAHREAFDAWAAAAVTLAHKLAAVDQAERDDQQALTAAVAADKPTPAPTLAAAEREALRAEEATKQAREKANDAVAELQRTLDAGAEELLPLAVAHLRDRLDAYTARLEAAKRDLDAARADLKAAVAAFSVASPALKRAGLGVPTFGAGVPAIPWPTEPPTIGVHVTLDRLETAYARATAARS